METIIVATDFSKSAKKAVKYAAALAKQLHTKLLLFNTFYIPVPTSHAPIALPNYDDLKSENSERLKILSADISSEYDIETEALSSNGYLVEDLKQLVAMKKAALIVMGMRGVSLTKKIFGSLTIATVREGFCPVLIVPEKATFRSIKNILFACDLSKLTFKTDLTIIKEIAKVFDAEVHILEVIKARQFAISDISSDEGTKIPNGMTDVLKGIRLSYQTVKDDDVVYGIEKSLLEQETDLLIMVPHKPHFWEAIFRPGNTKKMALKTNVPLLTLPNG